MKILKNVSAAPATGRSKSFQSVTLSVAALLLAVLAVSATAQAQSKSTLVVTAMNAGRFYGDPNPQFTGIVTGLMPGETITVTYTTIADSASSVGDYQIVPTLVDPDNHLGNYMVVINNGTLKVTPAPLSVVADDLTRIVGQANPAFTGTVTGVKNGEDITATYDSPAAATSQAGTYPILPTVKDGSGKISNYAVTVSNGKLTITQ